MSGRMVALAEAVTDLLNSASWTQTFTAVRTAVPRYEAKGGGLEVLVRPAGRKTEGRLARDQVTRIYSVDVVIVKRVEIADNEQVDPLIDQAEQIADWFEHGADGKPRVVATSPKAWIDSVEEVPGAYAWEYAVEDQFVAVRRLHIKCNEW